MSAPDEFDEAMAVANGTPAYRPQPRSKETVEDELLPDWLTTRGASGRTGGTPGRTGTPGRSYDAGSPSAAPARQGQAGSGGTSARGPERVDPWEDISRAETPAAGAGAERAAAHAPQAGAPIPEGPRSARGHRRNGEPTQPQPEEGPPAAPPAGDAAPPADGRPVYPGPAAASGVGAPEDHRQPHGPVRPPVITWAEAGARAARAARPAQPRTSPLDSAAGRVLSRPVVALTDLPAFDSSAMDGWAVAGPGPWEVVGVTDVPSGSGDGPPDYPRAGSENTDSERPNAPEAGILAGDTPYAALRDGSAVRIATGARMPSGATAVLRSERAHVHGGRLHLDGGAPRGSAAHGADVRPRGQECRSGDQLVAAGVPVTPAVLGLAAAAGYDELTVCPRLRAEVLVLGAELLWRGQPRDGMVRDALGPMVGPWLASLGAEVLVTRRLGDDAEALHEAVTTSTADLLVTTGGTAAGPVDHVRPTLDRLGARLLVDGVAVRPGHPMLLAALPGDSATESRSSRHLIGLPGNPLAAVAGLVTLAGPLIRGFAGRPDSTSASDARASGSARSALTVTQRGHPRDTQLLPVRRDAGEGTEASPVPYTGSAMLRGVAAATHLAVIPPGGLPVGAPAQLLELP